MFVLLHRQRPLRQPVRKPSVEVSVLCSAQHQVEKYEAGALDEDAQAGVPLPGIRSQDCGAVLEVLKVPAAANATLQRRADRGPPIKMIENSSTKKVAETPSRSYREKVQSLHANSGLYAVRS